MKAEKLGKVFQSENWKNCGGILIYSKKGICVVDYNWNISFM